MRVRLLPIVTTIVLSGCDPAPDLTAPPPAAGPAPVILPLDDLLADAAVAAAPDAGALDARAAALRARAAGLRGAAARP